MVEKPAGNEVTHVAILAWLSLKDLSPRGLSAWGVNFLLSIGANSPEQLAMHRRKEMQSPDQGRKGDRKAQLYQQSTKMEAFFICII